MSHERQQSTDTARSVSRWALVLGVSAAAVGLYLVLPGFLPGSTSDPVLSTLLGGLLVAAPVIGWRYAWFLPRRPEAVLEGGAHDPRRKPVSLSLLALALFAVSILWFTAQLATRWVIIHEGPDAAYQRSEAALQSSSVVLVFLLVLIFAPLSEEALLRGLVYPLLRWRGLSVIPSAVVVSLVFGLMHGNSVQFVATVPLGLVCALMYEITGRLRYSVLLHISYNALSMFVPSTTINKIAGHPQLTVIVAVGALASITALLALYSRTPEFVSRQARRLQGREEASAQAQGPQQ